jgi:hypothetical protein
MSGKYFWKTRKIEFLVDNKTYMRCVFLWHHCNGKIKVDSVVMNGKKIDFLTFLTLYAPYSFNKNDAIEICNKTNLDQVIHCKISDCLIDQRPSQIHDKGVLGCDK